MKNFNQNDILVNGTAPQPQAVGEPMKMLSVREFEEWLNDNRRHDVSSIFHEIVARYTKATRPPQIPEGYKLAPIKSTREMQTAGAQAARKYMQETGGNSPAVVYEAMIEAAPEVKP